MKKILLLVILTSFGFSQELFACSCLPPKPFLTVAPSTNLIVLAKVRRYLTYEDFKGETSVTSIEVEIEEIYQGKEERKTITVRGANCIELLSDFQINKTFVFAVLEGKNGDYYLSKCSRAWLSVAQNIATGNIAEDIKSMNLEELKSKIQKQQTSSLNSLLSYNQFFFDYESNSLPNL